MDKLDDLLKNLSDKERQVLIKQIKAVPSIPKEYEIGDKKVCYGVISDAHIGNKCYDRNLMKFAAQQFNKRKVDFVIDGGDQCDGFYRDRAGHVFELKHIGADDQLEVALEEYSQIKSPILGITGNHTRNTFFANAGYDIGKRLEERLDNYTYLGQDTGTIKLPYKNKIQVIHPDSGSSYAISYRPQKIAESLDGGTKPNVLHIGHFHKAEYLFYRNINIIQNGTLESQTPFMRNHHLSAHKGFWIINLEVGKNGVTKFAPEFYPAY